jgi:hypothetical protein
MRTKIILPDSGPLFSFVAVPGGLDLLLAAGLPIALTDYIKWEATRSGSPTAKLIDKWIADHPDEISVVETERGQDRIDREKKAALCSRHHRRPLLAQILIYYAPFSSLFDHGSHHGRVADYLDFARQAIGTG